jgi:hypothetical protein
MREAHRIFSRLGVALAMSAGFIFAGFAAAHDGHDHGGAQHGGIEAKTKRHHFEAVFSKAGLTLYAHDSAHEPLDASRLKATATFYHPSSPKPWFTRELQATAASPGQPPASLGLRMDLSKVPSKDAKVAFQVSGLPDPAEPAAAFTVPFKLADEGELTVAKATQADQADIDALKLCPVSHEELGSMGTPLKVSRGRRSTIICCKGCLKAIQANPDRFLSASAAAPKAEPEHHEH